MRAFCLFLLLLYNLGRQGSGGRTHLVSPSMAAAAAINGCLTDVRKSLLSLSSTPSFDGDNEDVKKMFNFVDFSEEEKNKKIVKIVTKIDGGNNDNNKNLYKNEKKNVNNKSTNRSFNLHDNLINKNIVNTNINENLDTNNKQNEHLAPSISNPNLIFTTLKG
jgi:hypothetical protein